MKRILNIFTLIAVFLIVVNVFNVKTSWATSEEQILKISALSTTIDPNDYEPDQLTDADAGVVTDKIGIVLGTIRNISVVVSVIALMIIGLKYVFGSVEEKANYKATLVPYVIGFVLAIAGTTLVDFIYNMVN